MRLSLLHTIRLSSCTWRRHHTAVTYLNHGELVYKASQKKPSVAFSTTAIVPALGSVGVKMPRPLLIACVVSFAILHSEAVLIIPLDPGILPLFPTNLVHGATEAALGLPMGAFLWASIIALKGAVFIGVIIAGALDGGTLVRKRSVQQIADTEDELLSTIGHLDTHGCILKMLCLLQAESPDDLTPEEGILVDLLSNSILNYSTEVNATVLRPSEEGGLPSHSAGDCDAFFGMCPYEREILRGLLRQVFGCGMPFS
ncbi:uncharacterized protein LOC122265035 [Penaeus japonicus]|uniref:uncharacterized protein LOC122265035 n=1 Tax=Penaeus japonicus TaxID=27405 RepID=UPI001C7100B1|nr:uncharacterized protein LOC122265035 [Penaeus japonicus]